MLRAAVLAQAAKDVLDIDHRVVDQFADGNGEAAERHGVDGEAQRLENQGGDQGSRPEWRSAEMSVVRQFSRKTNRTSATTITASMRTCVTVVDRGLDEGGLPEQKLSALDAVPACVRCSLASAVSISRVSRTVSASGLLLDAR